MKLNHAQGQQAEDQAMRFLEQQGCSLIERNWHCPFGEIDLIMQYDDILLFIEVKYRKNKGFGGAAYSVTYTKLTKLQRSIECYLQQKKLTHLACRLDAVLIEGDSLPQWITNITG